MEAAGRRARLSVELDSVRRQRGWRRAFIRVSKVLSPGFPLVRVLEVTVNAHVLG